MAPGIAAACVAAGASVVIVGRDPDRTGHAAREAGDAVGAAPIAPEGFAGCDLVIETVREDLGLKRELLSQIEDWIEAGTLVATNTSSLPVEDLASALRRPERLAGMHFLNPADVTAVVEIVPGPATAPDTIEQLAELADRMDKTPLVLRRDCPGFIWNRLQMAMVRECIHLLEEGVADLATIDAAVSDGLAPRWVAAGPLATTDLGGSATFRLVADQLFRRLSSASAVSERLGPGFYEWTEESVELVKALRQEALCANRALAERRRAVPLEPRIGR
jgi:3-hydroxybutyryl-CoA dehydrogenase